MATSQNRGSATLIFAIAAIALTGCGVGTSPEERAATRSSEIRPRLLTADVVKTLNCADAKSVQVSVDVVNRSAVKNGDRRSLNKWIGDREVTDVQAALNAQVAKACASPASASASSSTSPSASPSASASPSSSPSTSPSAATPQKPSNFGSWKKVVSEPPAGLEDAVEVHADRLGWDWEDAKDWARSETSDSESRVILVFDEMTRDEARLAVGINPKTPVPVVHTTECVSLMGPLCPTTGAIVVLSQLNEGAVPLLGSGIVRWGDDFYLVVDLVGTQVKE